ncbi:MAG: hypothetical protein ABJO09_12515 [Hyphomicrobiales bacterium]
MRQIATTVFTATLLSLSSAGIALAGEDCQCRAGGQYYSTGSLICMGKGENRQMARCEMALNNTSWKMLGEQCPYALSTPSNAGQLFTPYQQSSVLKIEPS